MTDPADIIRAVNRLIAASLVHREALRSGQGPSRQAEFLTAVDEYLAVRDPLSAARDNWLIEHPHADAYTGFEHVMTPETAGRWEQALNPEE